MKSLRSSGTFVAFFARARSSIVPAKNGESVSTLIAAAPPCSYSFAITGASRSRSMSPWLGLRRLISAMIPPFASAAAHPAVRRLAADDDRRRGVEDDGVAARTRHAVEHRADDRRAFARIAAAQRLDRTHRDPRHFRPDLELAHDAVVHLGDERRPRGAELVDAAGAVHDPRANGAEVQEGARHRLDAGAIVHADDL